MNHDSQSAPPTDWPARLREFRRALHIDQRKTGQLLGVSREWISRLERGQDEFSELMRFRLVAVERSQLQISVNPYSQGSVGISEVVQEAPSAIVPRMIGPDTTTTDSPPALDDLRELMQKIEHAAISSESRAGYLLEELRATIAERLAKWEREDRKQPSKS